MNDRAPDDAIRVNAQPTKGVGMELDEHQQAVQDLGLKTLKILPHALTITTAASSDWAASSDHLHHIKSVFTDVPTIEVHVVGMTNSSGNVVFVVVETRDDNGPIEGPTTFRVEELPSHV